VNVAGTDRRFPPSTAIQEQPIMSITRTLVAALAVGALAVPAAQARPQQVPDMHASVAQAAAAKAQRDQDLRWLDARDPGERIALPRGPGHPSEVGRSSRPAVTEPSTADTADTGGGADWTTIGLGIAGSLLAVGSLAAVTSRRRTQRLRVSA
jgi:hypothetical protein